VLLSDLSKHEFLKYQEAYGTDASIARIFKVSRQAVSKRRKILKIKSSTSNLKRRNEWVIRQYNQNVSVEDIAKAKMISVSHVYKIISKRIKTIQQEMKYG